MRILITGATGYIGSRVARRLHGKGHTVVAAVRDEAGAGRLREMGVPADSLVAPLADTRALAGAARSADAVVHLAFEHRTNDLRASTELDGRVAEAFIEALSGTGKCLIGTTATGVVGNTGPVPVDEDHPTDPEHFGAGRRAIEAIFVAGARREVRSVVIRPPILTHCEGNHGVVARLVGAARRHGAAGHLGSGENHVTSVHVEDLADLYALALEKAPPGRVYNGAGANVSTGDVARAIGRALGLPVKSIERGEANAIWGAFFASLLALDHRVSNARARSELGWRPYTTTNGLEDDIRALAALPA